jgi:hypothetical protein
MYSGLFMDLASQGYFVFSQFHMDGTCIYTETTEDKPILFEPLFDFKNRKVMYDKISLRQSKIIQLYNEIKENSESF